MLEKNPKPVGSFYSIINLHGLGGHSSTPFKTHNPLVAGFDFIHAVQNKVWWEFSQFNNVSLLPVDFDSGTKANIIPETASITLYGEYAEEAEFEKLKEIISSALDAVSAYYHVTYSLSYKNGGNS